MRGVQALTSLWRYEFKAWLDLISALPAQTCWLLGTSRYLCIGVLPCNQSYELWISPGDDKSPPVDDLKRLAGTDQEPKPYQELRDQHRQANLKTKQDVDG